MGDYDRIKSAFTRIVLSIVARTDYHALYPATALAQNADLSLELRPDNPKMPQLSKVKIRTGIPGVSIKVAAGARFLLGYENGDPKRPYAGLWDTSELVEISFNGGLVGLAKAGHQHDYVSPVGAAVTTNGVTPQASTTLLKVP